MKKKRIIIFLLLAVSLFGLSSNLEMFSIRRRLREIIPSSRRKALKNYLLPYTRIGELEKKLNWYIEKSDWYVNELDNQINIQKKLIDKAKDYDSSLKKSLKPINFKLVKDKYYPKEIYSYLKAPKGVNNLKDTEYTFKRFKPVEDLLIRGIWNRLPGSAYLDKNEENIFFLSSTGIIGFSKLTNLNGENITFKQIENNLDLFLDEEKMKEHSGFSFKDLFIKDNVLYVSFTNELYENCWNTSILSGKLNYNKIIFKPLFVPSECIDSKNNRDNVFEPLSSGGRIKALDNSNILLSTGEFRSRYLAQDSTSVMGKIIKINILNGSYEIISMGHRNIQGLFYDEYNNLLLSTEHGPYGGDEINILDFENYKLSKIPNYGWPISSYGEHYKKYKTSNIEKKYPLYKSHSDYGFIEPIRFFVPSIAISETIGINTKEKEYAFASLKNRGLYFFSLDPKLQINDIKRVFINERIRDLLFFENKIIMYLENTASIAVFQLNKLTVKN